MLAEFQPDGMFFKYLPDDLQTIDFNGFKHFINCYFGAELPADLIQQLFLSFAQSPTSTNGGQGKIFKIVCYTEIWSNEILQEPMTLYFLRVHSQIPRLQTISIRTPAIKSPF